MKDVNAVDDFAIKIIDATPAHHAFIHSSFLRDVRATPAARGAYASVLAGKMADLLESAAWRALVATPDGDEILGWIVFRDAATLGWLHVKRIYRGRGVALALTAAARLSPGVVHMAFMPDRYSPGWPTLRFRPYLPDVAAAETALVEQMMGEAS